MLYYLWDIMKVLEMEWGEAGLEPGEETGAEAVQRLEKQLRRRIRVKIRRYLTRYKHRNMRLLANILCAVLRVTRLFGYRIGVDRVSENSMYPYLNDEDWTVYSRRGRGIRRDNVIVFEKNREIMVKRVAGLPEDHMEMDWTGSRVVLNGVEEREEYVAPIKSGDEKDRELLGVPQMVTNGQYPALGDDRAKSVDSRGNNVEAMPSEGMLGRVVRVVRKGR